MPNFSHAQALLPPLALKKPFRNFRNLLPGAFETLAPGQYFAWKLERGQDPLGEKALDLFERPDPNHDRNALG